MKTYTTLSALKNYLLVLVIMSLSVAAQSQTSQFSSTTTTVTNFQLASFNGSAADGKNKLAWLLSQENTASTVIVERSTNGNDFHQIAEFWVNMEGNTQKNFTYNDSKAGGN